MSDFEDEILNDLGRYKETEDAVAKGAFMHHLAELLLMGSIPYHHSTEPGLWMDIPREE